MNEAEPMPQLTPPSPYLLSGLARCAGCGGPIIAMSRHHGRRRGYFYGCAHNWKRGPAICSNNLHLPQAILDDAVVDAMVEALDAELVEAAVAQAFARLTETATEAEDRRPMLEGEIAEARRREQRLADAVAQGSPDDAAPEALLSALRAEESRRKDLEQQLATLPQPPEVVPVDRERVARELGACADDMRGVLLRHGAPARDALQALLLDRVDCTPVLVAGTRGYAFIGDGTFGGLLAASTWPTTSGGPNGIRTRVYGPPRAFSTVSEGYVMLTQRRTPRDSNSAGVLTPDTCYKLRAPLGIPAYSLIHGSPACASTKATTSCMSFRTRIRPQCSILDSSAFSCSLRRRSRFAPSAVKTSTYGSAMSRIRSLTSFTVGFVPRSRTKV